MKFRRRRFRRFGPFQPRARRLEQRVRHELRRANELVESGQFLEAADVFEHLAAIFRKRGMPQFPQLLIQAGRARINGGDQETGTERIKTGIIALLEGGRLVRLARLRPGLQEFFLSRKLDAGWQEIQRLLDQAGLSTPTPARVQTARLPAKCPYCGASIILEELEESNTKDAICGYCGSLVQADES